MPTIPDSLVEYDRTRELPDKAVRAICYAPYASLYFDLAGRVRVCCHNWKHVLGDARRDSIDDMWNGAQIALLRDAMANYELGRGCEFCANMTAGGRLGNSTMRNFDRFAVTSPAPEWPQQMEFSISNVCNLECVMCTGFFSSAIRARREQLPPRPHLYSVQFIDSLRKYLPHLEQAKFLGGEPFLISEYFQLWDMMIAAGLSTRCHVTTNGTQYNDRVERVMQSLPVSFAVSLDGATRQTVESIRVNADYDEQLRNLKRFRDYTRERKTDLSLTFCFMRQNWREFGDYCLFADEWDCSVGVNTVVQPPEFAIYNLPLEELRKIGAVMEQQAPRLDALLKRNHAVWFTEFSAVRRRCEQLDNAQREHQQPQ